MLQRHNPMSLKFQQHIDTPNSIKLISTKQSMFVA